MGVFLREFAVVMAFLRTFLVDRPKKDPKKIISYFMENLWLKYEFSSCKLQFWYGSYRFALWIMIKKKKIVSV